MEEKAQEKTHEPAAEKGAEPESHPVHHKSKSPKWILIVLAILITLAVLSSAFYFLGKSQNTKKTEPTTSPISTLTQETAWKTYSNVKFNYTVNYPGDWSVREYSDSKEGAAFNPVSQPGYPDSSDAISISAGQKTGNYVDKTLEEYAKVGASVEIQNYNSLASIKKITTVDGAVGYETTWMVQPMTINGQPPTGKGSESLPITYFEIPGNKTMLVRVTLSKKEDLATYEKMLTTVKVMAPLTPIPTVDETAVLKYVIKKYITLKRGGNENDLTITVSKIDGDYAQGGAGGQGGGGMWFAAKQDGTWRLVWDGNGTIDCDSFSLYPNFSKTILPECYDTATQNMIKR